jgi:hypothetical protein
LISEARTEEKKATSHLLPLRLQPRSTMSWRELTVCVGLLTAIAAAVYWPHVAHGGLYWDDWSHASDYRDHGWWWLASHLWRDVIPGRPALAALLPVPAALFGTNAAAQTAMAVTLGLATSVCFYVFLRALSVEPVNAAAIAGLSLLFPWSEAARLWPTASLNNLAVCAYLLGSVVALHALRLNGRHAAPAHAAATLLYLSSLLVYEVAGCAIALSLVLYRSRAPVRRAVARWLVDTVLVLATIGLSAVYTSRVRHVGSLAERLADVPSFMRQGLSILAMSFLPRGLDSVAARGTVLLAIGATIGSAAVIARRRDRKDLRRWLVVFATATVGVASAYVMFLGSGLYPSGAGVDTRLHSFAGLAFAALCYSLVMIAVELLPLRGRRQMVSLLAVTALAVGFAGRTRDDIANWDAATVAQRSFLSDLKRVLPRPSPRSTIFSFGYPAEAADGIPIFTHFWDMNGALRLTYDDPSLHGLPIYRPGEGVVCAHSFAYGTSAGTRVTGRYGRTIFVDVVSQRHTILRSQANCKADARLFFPGPLIAGARSAAR